MRPKSPYTNSQRLRAIFKLFKHAAAACLLLGAASCSKNDYDGTRLIGLEKEIISFYKSDRATLEVSQIDGGRKLSAICMFLPYHSKVPTEEREFSAVNSFFQEHKIEADEEHWHLMVQVDGKWFITRFEAYGEFKFASNIPTNCIFTKVIKFSKMVHPNKDVYLVIGV